MHWNIETDKEASVKMLAYHGTIPWGVLSLLVFRPPLNQSECSRNFMSGRQAAISKS